MSERDHPSETTLEARLLKRFPESYMDDNGRIVEKRVGVQYQDGHAMDKTFIADLTALFEDARRTTSMVEHLVIEAELADERGTVGNPAEPFNDEVERAAREQIESRGLTPAWEVDA